MYGFADYDAYEIDFRDKSKDSQAIPMQIYIGTTSLWNPIISSFLIKAKLPKLIKRTTEQFIGKLKTKT